MDTVQSLLGMSPAAAPQHQAGTVSVSAHEVQQLRAELQKQQAYINVKNDEIVSPPPPIRSADIVPIRSNRRHRSCLWANGWRRRRRS